MAQSSVRCTGGASLSSASQPTITGDWTYAVWIKCNAGQYGAGVDSLIFAGGPVSGTEGFGIGVLSGANTTLQAFVFRNTGVEFLPTTVLTGSDVGWVCCAFRHPAGSPSYNFSFRREGVTTWTTVALTLTTQMVTAGSVFLGTDQFNEAALDADVRDLFCQAVVMTDAALLTASQNINTAPAGTNLHYLQLLDAASAATNGGTGGNWTVVPTLLTAATEPTEITGASANVIGYHYVTA